MSGLQSSFNSNRYWIGRGAVAYCHVPANQFSGLMPVETLQAHERSTQAEPQDREDHLVFIFLIFFLIYVLCRITL